MSIWRAAIIAIAALGALSACRADIAVHVEVAPDGGGTVTASVAFDAEVMAYIPDLDQILRLDDVMATGWVIDQSRLDGGLVITLTKSFASQDQLAVVLAELDGPDGIFGRAELEARRNGAVTEYELVVDMRLERQVTDLIDPSIAEVLDGELFGTPVRELERRAGRPLDETVTLVVTADVPGGSGRFPEVGVASLGQGPDELRVVGEVVDQEIAAADREAADARDRVSGAANRAFLIWVGVIAVVVALVVGLRRRAPTVRPPAI